MGARNFEIERRDRMTHGEYVARLPNTDGKAKLTWTARSGRGIRAADHTFVPPEMRGKGIAAEMVEMMVHDAKREGFKIVPACSYVEAEFKRHPEWSELRG